MVDWDPVFKAFVADHPEVGAEAFPPVRLPPDFACVIQLSPSHLLVWTGDYPVIAVARKVIPNAAMGQAGRAR